MLNIYSLLGAYTSYYADYFRRLQRTAPEKFGQYNSSIRRFIRLSGERYTLLPFLSCRNSHVPRKLIISLHTVCIEDQKQDPSGTFMLELASNGTS